ncbi:CAP domain-containing protein [Psychrobacter celer]|uniref:CAP domain-containing protein n=2 Tax=Psychrobacter celer TaxID=306572 RepID=UPI0018DF4961|nr:CAP domain-containing protein [Psychrobacter celer]
MPFNTSSMNLATAFFLTLFLSACGGGGDASNRDSHSSTKPVNKEKIDQADEGSQALINSSALSHNAKAALTASNTFSLARTSCGLRGLSVDPALDDIAIDHANYIRYVFANSSPTVFNPHYESEMTDIAEVTGSNNPFFKGRDFSDRLLAADYQNARYSATENIAHSIYYSSVGELAAAEVVAGLMAKSLLAAPYHLRSLMVPKSSLTGTSVVTYQPYGRTSRNSQGYVLVTHASATKATQDRTVAGIFTYPCQGVSGTATALYNETPDPVKHTGRDLRINPIGQPIYINVPSAETIEVSNVKFYDTQRNIEVPIELLDYRQDPYKNTVYALPANEAFILPMTDDLKSCEIARRQDQSQQCGLYGNTEYRVSYEVLIDNKILQQQSFSFTTGEVNY